MAFGVTQTSGSPQHLSGSGCIAPIFFQSRKLNHLQSFIRLSHCVGQVHALSWSLGSTKPASVLVSNPHPRTHICTMWVKIVFKFKSAPSACHVRYSPWQVQAEEQPYWKLVIHLDENWKATWTGTALGAKNLPDVPEALWGGQCTNIHLLKHNTTPLITYIGPITCTDFKANLATCI